MTDALVQDSPPRPGTPSAPSAYALPTGLDARLGRRVVAPARPEMHECVTPFTGEVIGRLPLSTVDSVDQAYRDAREAAARWAARPIAERTRFLTRLHDLLLRHQNELLDLIQLDAGKARKHAFEEVLDAAGVCRHYAKKAEAYLGPKKHLGAIPLLTTSVELRHPKGVVGVVSPWNYPLSMSITDALPALVAGNAVVLRPDTQSALTALRAVELIDQAGLPEGVLQVVLGPGSVIGKAVLDRADYVMYTGSTQTGRGVARDAGERLVGASLELGGKNPMYVRADASPSRAAEGAVRAAYGSAGQLCISAERLIVHEQVADEFLKHFLRRVEAMRIGPGLQWGIDMGTLVTAEQLERVSKHVEDAKAKGAAVLAGGRARPDLGPLFYEPTVLTNVTGDMLCRDEETFGPVVSVYRVANDQEALALANDTPYGLNASVWTRDIRRGRELAAQIRTGTVNVNEGYAAAWGSNGSPMGGMGASGLGRRHGAEGIQKYTESQNVAVQRPPGFAVPKGVPEKVWARAMATGLRVMKGAGLS